MPPKAKAAKAAAKAPAARGAPAAKVAPAPLVAQPPPKQREPLDVEDALAKVVEVVETDWEVLAELAEPPDSVSRALRSVLAILGDPEPGNWSTAKTALADPPALLRELQALGPWGAFPSHVDAATEQLADALNCLEAPPGAVAAVAGGAKAKAKTCAKAKAAPAKAAAPPPPTPGVVAALALGVLVEAFIAEGKRRPPAFPMVPPSVPYSELHLRLQQAFLGKQPACVVCPDAAAANAALMFCQTSGAMVCNVKALQVRVGLSKDLSDAGARAEFSRCLKDAMVGGHRCVLWMGDVPFSLHRFCDAKQAPDGIFRAEEREAAAKAMGLEGIKDGFHIILIVQLSKAVAEKLLPSLVPSFEEEMALLLLDGDSLPSHETICTAAGATEALAVGSARQAVKARPSLHAALKLLALPPEKAPTNPGAALPSSAADSDGTTTGTLVNTEEFEYCESFGPDWETRWGTGPATMDENGKAIRAGLIKAELVRYPANPKDAKSCMQLVGGAAHAPCTGIWTIFSPLCRPTEVEFEFTVNGKVDQPNACVVFTEREFNGSLPDTKVGVQFTVRGGMQLCGGAGNLVKISNDGKIQHDKWNRVLLQIDWGEKIIVGQVDTRGKGYAPAIQTVPFRDQSVEGFGYLYIYNTDVQATCWFSSLRVAQNASTITGRDGLDARAAFAAKLKQREYDAAVAADMEVGMKMGAIKSTAQHGMNLAQEQAANSASAAGAAMGR